MHELLLLQLQQYTNDSTLLTQQPALLTAISDTYGELEADRQKLDNSLVVTKTNLDERNQLLHTHLQTLIETQDKLQKSLTALNATFDATGEIILSLDNFGRLIKSNKMGKELLPDIAKYEGKNQTISWQNVHKMLLNPWHLTEIVD